MSDPCAIEDDPVRLRDRALVADHERDDDAGVRCALGERSAACELLDDAVAQARAHALNDVAEGPREVVELAGAASEASIAAIDIVARLVDAGTHVAGRAQVLFEQPVLVVEAVGVGRAMRSLEANHETPSLARLDARRRGGRRPVVRARRIPTERETGRHSQRRAVCIAGLDPLHIEREAHPAIDQ